MISYINWIFDLFDPVDQVIKENCFQGAIYVVIGEQRHDIIENSLIHFIKLPGNGEYYVEFTGRSIKEQMIQQGVPVYLNMDLGTFELEMEDKRDTHFQWTITENMQQRIGCRLFPHDKDKFRQLFCRLIRRKNTNRPLFRNIQYCKKLKKQQKKITPIEKQPIQKPPPPRPHLNIPKKQQSVRKNSKKDLPEEIKEILFKQSSNKITVFISYGTLYQTVYKRRSLAAEIAVIVIKKVKETKYEMQIISQEKKVITKIDIDIDFTYEVSPEKGYLKWLNSASNNKKVNLSRYELNFYQKQHQLKELKMIIQQIIEAEEDRIAYEKEKAQIEAEAIARAKAEAIARAEAEAIARTKAKAAEKKKPIPKSESITSFSSAYSEIRSEKFRQNTQFIAKKQPTMEHRQPYSQMKNLNVPQQYSQMNSYSNVPTNNFTSQNFNLNSINRQPPAPQNSLGFIGNNQTSSNNNNFSPSYQQMSISPDNRWILTYKNGFFQFYEINNGLIPRKQLKIPQVVGQIKKIIITNNLDIIILNNSGKVYSLSSQNQQIIQYNPDKNQKIVDIAINNQNNQMVSAVSSSCVFELVGQQLQTRGYKTENSFERIVMKGGKIVTSSRQGKVRIYQSIYQGCKAVCLYQTSKQVIGIDKSNDHRFLVVTHPQSVYLYPTYNNQGIFYFMNRSPQLKDRQEPKQIPIQSNNLLPAKINQNGQYIVCPSRSTITLFEIQTQNMESIPAPENLIQVDFLDSNSCRIILTTKDRIQIR